MRRDLRQQMGRVEMARVVNCSRRTAVTTDEANDGLVAKVQEHNRKAHRTLIGREQGLLLARLHSWGHRQRSFAFESASADSWLGVVRVR